MSSTDEEVSTVLPGIPTSPRLARRFVNDALGGWSLQSLCDSVELLTNELVTNVVLHVRGDLLLRLRRLPERLRVEVSDTSPSRPHASHPVGDGVEATTGRGLMLIEAMSDGWGVEPTETGKTIWFEVAG